MSWLKAVLKSNRVRKLMAPASAEMNRSFVTLRRVLAILYRVQKPDWKVLIIDLHSLVFGQKFNIRNWSIIRMLIRVCIFGNKYYRSSFGI